MQGNASSPLGDNLMRAQYADALASCNKYQIINYQFANEVSPLDHAASSAFATRSLAEGEARWGRGPTICTTVAIKPCGGLIEPTPQAFMRDCNLDANWKPALGIPSSLLRGSHEAARR